MKELWLDNYRLGRTRGRFKRIRNARRRWPKGYDIQGNDILRGYMREEFLMKHAIPAIEWTKIMNQN